MGSYSGRSLTLSGDKVGSITGYEEYCGAFVASEATAFLELSSARDTVGSNDSTASVIIAAFRQLAASSPERNRKMSTVGQNGYEPNFAYLHLGSRSSLHDGLSLLPSLYQSQEAKVDYYEAYQHDYACAFC